ncbi:hypothetical protein [Streptomyces sp. MP131-18]|uniref:hypothetical protein n=1 Tax=Streptomyces sp. MP131-18 TaxID=1857892 RepID=UPI00097C534B|nr:hypothetical protein [Streptomyces sp. MP131-18]ONK09459.1 hypothetical protein STBA_01590 [Streptomyces sp. MP131-18]
MAWERISKILESPDGAFVFAQADRSTGAFRVVCSGCSDLEATPYRSGSGAILAASYHADHDPAQRHVPTR